MKTHQKHHPHPNRSHRVRGGLELLGAPLMALGAIQIWRCAIIDGFTGLAILRVVLVSFVFVVMLIGSVSARRERRAESDGRGGIIAS